MKIAIFDLDGTLADTLEDLADAVNNGLKQLGYPIHPYESYKTFVGDGVQMLCYRALPDDKKDETTKLHELFNEYYSVHFLDKTILYPGIKETLEKLSNNGVILAVATNKPQNFAVKIIEKLLSNIDFIKILGGCTDREKKPDPAIIHEIIDELPIGTKAFMIGDSDVDIKTANNAGISSIGCLWGFRTEKELSEAGADYIAEKATDIFDYILL